MYWIRTDKEYRPKRLKIWGLGLFLALQINALSHNFHHNSSGACKYNLSYTNYPRMLINNCNCVLLWLKSTVDPYSQGSWNYVDPKKCSAHLQNS